MINSKIIIGSLLAVFILTSLMSISIPSVEAHPHSGIIQTENHSHQPISEVIPINGEKEFDSILIVADSSTPTSPCGACRQLLFDYAPDIVIVMSNLKKDKTVDSIKNLLIKPFSLDN